MTPSHFPRIDRRAMLALSTAGLLAGSRAVADTAGGIINQQNLQSFIMMRGALDDRLVIGFLSGRYDGVVDGERTALFGLFSATFSRYRAKDDGYEVIGFEQAYFTDLKSQEVLTHLKNPYTGEIVEVPITSLPPTKLLISSDLQFHSSNKLPSNVKLDMSASAPEIIGSEIFFVEQLYASKAPEDNIPRFSYSENTTLRAKLADVQEPSVVSVPCQTSFDAVVSWRPWLKMGNRPGFMTAFGHGSYGVSLADLPKPWLEASARIRPELLSHPEKVLEPLWRS